MAYPHELEETIEWISTHYPELKKSFFDGKDSYGKVVTNPTYGFGTLTLPNSKGEIDSFQIGVSLNSRGITISLIGIRNKLDLNQLSLGLGAVKITKYCIQFKSFKALNHEILRKVIDATITLTSN